MSENTGKKQTLFLGCVADDFTGASDAASFLVNEGLPVLLYNGIPKNAEGLENCAAAVIALKSRSAPVSEAVKDSREAFRFLVENGAKQLYSKYCSTFDSTSTGNIGPVTDAMLDELNLPYTLLCPSLPVNKRQVRDGHLYVEGVPLNESPMKNHPLNPMWDSFIPTLMKDQGKYPSLVLNAGMLNDPAGAALREVKLFGERHPRFYVVPDYENDEQGRRIVEIFGSLRFLTGGSGLLGPLANRCRREYGAPREFSVESKTSGPGILLSGSCSKATREQIQTYRKAGGPALAVSPDRLLDGTQTVDEIWSFAQEHDNPLIYSAGAEPDGKREPEADSEKASRILEKTMSQIGRRAFERGYTRIVVAGGETSGAVMLALGFDAFLIGQSIAPGVPVMVPVQRRDVRLALKSGNFGQPDFFARALEMTGR
ncbi:MAG: four-carbon acid sugar kinase family protein [Synergistaceae bacterium]|jgi:uncharacterized protein YgbK (DUF1537 family)|nr:four-carbon acid sugar kinase family protein [Synergistaceae bacterium]